MAEAKQPMYIFDVDGVLNSLEDSTVNKKILAIMAHFLADGLYVAINTGRSWVWLEENVVAPLEKMVGRPKDLDRLYIIAEFGGSITEFSGGVSQTNRSFFSLDEYLMKRASEIFEAHPEFHSTLRNIDGKRTMVSFGRNPEASLVQVIQMKDRFAEVLKRELAGEHAHVGVTASAVDVYAPEAGKWAGSQLIYDWLQRVSPIEHERFICLGDSRIDYEMAGYFSEHGLDTTLVFTGAELHQDHDYKTLKIIKTDVPYDEGAVTYLRSFANINL